MCRILCRAFARCVSQVCALCPQRESFMSILGRHHLTWGWFSSGKLLLGVGLLALAGHRLGGSKTKDDASRKDPGELEVVIKLGEMPAEADRSPHLPCFNASGCFANGGADGPG